MDWNSLPWEMVELILLSLTLAELAQVSPTCRTFQTLFRRQMAKRQKLLCDQALECFGPERIDCLVEFLVGFCTRASEHLTLQRDPHEFWVTADRALHMQPGYHVMPAQHDDDVGHVRMWVCIDSVGYNQVCMRFTIRGPGSSLVYLSFPPNQKALVMSIAPGGDDDSAGVALAYALLSGTVGPSLKDRGLAIDVRIWNDADVCTLAGLENHLTPLRLLAWLYTVTDIVTTIKGCAPPIGGESSDSNSVTLSVHKV
jgi:hypothetical protein